jgi:Cd2+/Zn2+-exporting ATPase
MKKLKLELGLVLPEINHGDDCVHFLTERLQTHLGVDYAHIDRMNGRAELCIHYDPNLLPLPHIERLAQLAGAEVTSRYRHEQIPISGLKTADAADVLTRQLAALPGMLHTNVNYAAGVAFVAYDTALAARADIDQVLHPYGNLYENSYGNQPLEPRLVQPAPSAHEAGQHGHHDHHDHGSAPAFLPHWAQERWPLLLVAAAGLFLLVGWVGETFFAMPAQVAWLCYVLAYLAGGYDIATHAIPGLFKGQFDTDVLMLAAAAGAAILGEWAEGAFLLFLFGLGHAGEHYALDRARNAIGELGALMPKRAFVKRGDQIVEQPVEALAIDEIVVVRPGDRIPVDGEIVRGASAIDQATITGESVPVVKGAGETVFAGSINTENALDIRVTQVAQDNTLSRIMRLVAEAQEQQSPTQQLTQRFTAWFVPGVLIFVGLVIVAPPLLGWMNLTESFYRGMLLLVAASPCALAIGTPAAVLAGIAQGARSGVLIKGGVHLENLGALNVVAFDKTGTLTEGKFTITDIITTDSASPDELLSVAAAVEQQSSHPLAVAVLRAAQKRQLALPPSDGLENISGRGVKSTVDGQPVLIGSLQLFRETDGHTIPASLVDVVERMEAAGKTTMAVSQNGRFLGVLGLADEARPNVRATMDRLLALGVKKLVMLTGDNESVARRIGAEVGVTDVRASLLPEQKLDAIKAMQQEHGLIAMVGDGVNDAPALATATVGIAMGGAGTAVALETADVALMADDLDKLPFAVGLSRFSRAIIRQNLAIALGVIVLLIFTSVLGIVQLSGTVVLHEGSTIVVVLNALRLLTYRK